MSQSSVHCQNAFLSSLAEFNFNIFPLFVIDPMHEFELGVWPMILTHLIRMIYTCSNETVWEFDRWWVSPIYMVVSCFDSHPQLLASSYIWSGHYSKVWKQCLWNEEAYCMWFWRFIAGEKLQMWYILILLQTILQCIIPVIKGLLHEWLEKHILNLLFLLATWHTYAKLWLHTDHTLDSFDKLTWPLGALIRHFGRKLSDSFPVKELPKEVAAQQQRVVANFKKKPMQAPVKNNKKPNSSIQKKGVHLNLHTYKLHALGDYVTTIHQRGTMDSIAHRLWVKPSLLSHRLTNCHCISKMAKYLFLRSLFFTFSCLFVTFL